MSFSTFLFTARDAALARAYNAILEPPDDYYFDLSNDEEDETDDG